MSLVVYWVTPCLRKCMKMAGCCLCGRNMIAMWPDIG